ncbi:hypothetical protein evm_013017 [Chilo suppressalis]|nr:hypothetical protein evm_013017 [Chilo suppressalis]
MLLVADDLYSVTGFGDGEILRGPQAENWRVPLERTTRAGLRCYCLTVATIPTRTKKFGDSLLCRTIRKWNALPAHVFPPSYNLGSFKRGVKKQHAGRQDKLHHFEKIRSDGTLPLPYDYESATHPAWQFWRRLGKSGISTVATYKTQDPDGTVMKELGQHSKLLSDLDLVKINSVYGTKCFKMGRSRQVNKKRFVKDRQRGQ